MLAIAICWLWDRVTLGPEKPWSQKEYDRRLLNPDFAALERHFGCNIPQAIRELYADRDLILKRDFLIPLPRVPEGMEECDIGFFVPADVEGAKSWWPAEDKKLILADTGFGDPYYVELSLKQPNPLPVYVLYHDGGDTFKVADSLEEFIELCRSARPFD
ncbi:MAG: SMI1/KNR4 family protein [Pirellulaceae bacterium]